MIVDGIRAFCEKCQTDPDRIEQDDERGRVTSCACGAYKLADFRDRAEVIREALERAEGNHPKSKFLQSLRSQFNERGNLTEAQLEPLMKLAKK